MSLVKMWCGPCTPRLALFPTHLTLLASVLLKILWDGWLCCTFMILGYPQDKDISWCTLCAKTYVYQRTPHTFSKIQ